MINYQYSKYKESDLNWVSVIPSNWKIKRIKDFTKFTVGFTPSSENHDFYGDDYYWANISDVGSEYLSETSQCLSQLAIDEFNSES